MTIELGNALTRKDLQEELQSFAQSSLAHVFSKVLEDHLKEQGSLIARQLYDLTEFKEGPGKFVAKPAMKDPVSAQQGPPRSPRSAFERCFPGRDCQFSGSDRQSSGSGRQDDKLVQTNTLDVTNSSRIVLANAMPRRIELPLDDELPDMPLIGHVDLNHMSTCQGKFQKIIESPWFEKVIASLVVLNALALGYDANYMALHVVGSPSLFSRFTEIFFCVVFAVELSLRLAAFGRRFFTMPGWKWNCFDAALVVAQVFEQMLIFLSNNARDVNLGLLRLCRLLRVFRIARLLRTFHLFDELRAIIDSISASIVSLSWSMVLLVVLMYVASLVILESIAGAGQIGHDNELDYWFASLSRTILTMFECVVGGVSWDQVVSPIMSEISPLLGLAFCVYIAGCLFAIMNLVTGVFVQNAISSLREDKDEIMAERIKDLFFEDAPGDCESLNDEITWEIFQQKLEMKTMKDYFKAINMEISEAQALFQLMDVDQSGSLSTEEIVRACLQFRGPARSIDLAMMMKEVSETYQQVHKLEEGVKQILLKVNAAELF